METLSAPYLLLATPTLLDPNFVQSVVLMGHHDTEGAMGWIVNRLHEKPVRELLDPGQQQGVHAQTPLHLGGPVPADALLAVFHRAIDGVESAEIAPGLFLSRSAQVLPLLFSRDARPRTRAGPPGVRIRRLERGPARAARWRKAPGWPCLTPRTWPSPPASTTFGNAASSGSASTRRCSAAAPAASTDDDAALLTSCRFSSMRCRLFSWVAVGISLSSEPQFGNLRYKSQQARPGRGGIPRSE